VLFHRDSADLIEKLLSLGATLNQTSLLIPCSDIHVLIISEHREILKKYYHIALPDNDIVQTFMDKILFSEYAQKHDLSVLPSYRIRKGLSLDDQIQNIEYPCILKPAIKDSQWENHNPKDKVYKISNQAELIQKCRTIFEYIDECLVQGWMEGEDSNVYFCLMCYNAESQCIGAWSGRKIRQWPALTGSTASAEPVENLFILKESQRLFDCVQYKGLGSVEYKYCQRRKKYFIIEATVGRPDLQSRISVANGCNLPALLAQSFNPSLNVPQEKVRPHKWVNEWSEFYSFNYYRKHGRLSLMEWIRSISGSKSYALFSISDMRPFIYVFFYRLKKFIKYRCKLKRTVS